MSQAPSAGEQPAQFLADLQARTFQSALGLATRRSQAATDYLRALPSVRQPGDLVALQISYFSQMFDDYSAAVTDGLAAFTAPAEPAERKLEPPSQAAA